MVITKDFKGLAMDANENYVWPGDLIATEDVRVELDHWLTVQGNVLIDGDLTLKAQATVWGDVMVSGDVVCGEISCKRSIMVGGTVESRWPTMVYGGIFAEGNVLKDEVHLDLFPQKWKIFNAPDGLEKRDRVLLCKLAAALGTANVICEMRGCRRCEGYDAPERTSRVILCTLAVKEFMAEKLP